MATFTPNLFFHKFSSRLLRIARKISLGEIFARMSDELLNEGRKKRKKPFATKLELIIARHHLCRFDRIPRKQRKPGFIAGSIHQTSSYRLRNKWKLGYELRTINERTYTNLLSRAYNTLFEHHPRGLFAFHSLISSREGAQPTSRQFVKS